MKVFGIGLSKTGTTSLNKALNMIGVQSTHGLHGGDNNINDYIPYFLNNDFSHHVWNAFDGFTDIPIPLLYKDLDRRFPNSKFILTVRKRSDWIESASKHFNDYRKNARLANEQKTSITMPCTVYIRTLMYGMATFDKTRYLDVYIRHNKEVIRYFKHRKDLLVMNICDGDGWGKLCHFLKKPIPKKSFPCENKG